MVDDSSEELSDELRKHLKAKLSSDDFKAMSKRFDKRPAMDSALSYTKMFPNAPRVL
jgi:hypothetical protein